jgi:DNA-binding MarR family transcriptional regulator
MAASTASSTASPATTTGVPTVAWLTPTELHAWKSVIHGARHLFTALDHDLKPHGLSGDDYGVLVALSEAPDERLRMADLADVAAESRSRLSHHVGRLEARGLVERASCPEDRRGQFAVLTDAGRTLIQETAPHHVASVRTHFLDHLTPAELAVLGGVFARLSPGAAPEPAGPTS